MSSKLNILWTNADPITSEHMVMMYAGNAIRNGWWDEVQLIIWGATSKLVAENEQIQEVLKEMEHTGVKLIACKACVAKLGLQDKFEDLGIEVAYMGVPLTEIIKSGEKLITI